MTVIESEHATSADELMVRLRRSASRWIGKRGTEAGWVFRGQGRASYRLLPGAFRPVLSDSLIQAYIEAISPSHTKTHWATWVRHPVAPGSDAASRLPEAALEALIHAAIVRKFGLLADNVRHPVVMTPLLWHLHAQDKDFLSRYFYGDLTSADADLFAIAQHHGIPTPFLDWTFSPLAAAYFAVEQALRCDGDDDIAIWALRSDLFDREWDLVRHTVRAGVTPFLDAQEGLFVWCPKAYLLKLQRGEYIPFDDLIEECASDSRFARIAKPYLYKLTLTRGEVPNLLMLLWRERVTPAHLMPTFDHVTRALTLEMKWLRSSPVVLP